MNNSFVAPRRSKQEQINTLDRAISAIGLKTTSIAEDQAALKRIRGSDIERVTKLSADVAALMVSLRSTDSVNQVIGDEIGSLQKRLAALERTAARPPERDPGEGKWPKECDVICARPSCQHPQGDHTPDLSGCCECNCEGYIVPAESDAPATASDEGDAELQAAAVTVLTKIAEDVRNPEIMAHINWGHSESYMRGYNEGYEQAMEHAAPTPEPDDRETQTWAGGGSVHAIKAEVMEMLEKANQDQDEYLQSEQAADDRAARERIRDSIKQCLAEKHSERITDGSVKELFDDLTDAVLRAIATGAPVAGGADVSVESVICAAFRAEGDPKRISDFYATQRARLLADAYRGVTGKRADIDVREEMNSYGATS